MVTALVPRTAAALVRAARAADHAAAAHLFADYRARQAENTRRAQDSDLAVFVQFLFTCGVDVNKSVTSDPEAWIGVSWGLVAAFVQWQVQEGYAIGTVNRRLSTVKRYCKLAAAARAIGADELALILTVAGYRGAEGKRLNAQRMKTRKGAKKAEPLSISRDQAALLKAQADPREMLLMCLLLDHGLRVGEVAALTPSNFDLDRGVLTFYRQKVDKTQTHRLSAATLAAAQACLSEVPPGSSLFGVDRTIRTHVGQLGAAVGLDGLSPHDCRHAWATFATRAGTPVKALQDAGGWNSPAMPLRYAESAAIANDGVRLD